MPLDSSESGETFEYKGALEKRDNFSRELREHRPFMHEQLVKWADDDQRKMPDGSSVTLDNVDEFVSSVLYEQWKIASNTREDLHAQPLIRFMDWLEDQVDDIRQAA